jgi:hypothetical protein
MAGGVLQGHLPASGSRRNQFSKKNRWLDGYGSYREWGSLIKSNEGSKAKGKSKGTLHGFAIATHDHSSSLHLLK